MDAVDPLNSQSFKRSVLATETNFNEREYLAANPEVAVAVARGEWENGYAHFRECG